jgi:hypothetical protein
MLRDLEGKLQNKSNKKASFLEETSFFIALMHILNSQQRILVIRVFGFYSDATIRIFDYL